MLVHANGSARLQGHPADFLDDHVFGGIVAGKAELAKQGSLTARHVIAVPGFQGILWVELRFARKSRSGKHQ